MRTKIHHQNSNLMRYGIREIVSVSEQLAKLDPEFKCITENIGDPVAKGWETPAFVKEILAHLILSKNGASFGYSHSSGCLETRKWVIAHEKKYAPNVNLDYGNILFSNGLGSGLSTFYRMLAPGARIIQPNPGYPAHISLEQFFAGSNSLGYRLNPHNLWQPDLEDLEQQIRQHPEIAGILLINPNNPTGTIYNSETLEAIVQIAEREQLMIISDEVYFRLVFNGGKYVHISQLANHRVPLVVMRSISKDIPWPGARCGWMEFYNLDLDPDYRLFFESVQQALLIEVSAATLPQLVIPLIYDAPEYSRWLKQYNRELEAISNDIAKILSQTAGITVHPIQGAFYMMVLFGPDLLNNQQHLHIKNPDVNKFIQKLVSSPGLPFDKRFIYYLLARTGICVVPGSDFNCPYPGFRITTLERDPVRRKENYTILSKTITEYLASA